MELTERRLFTNNFRTRTLSSSTSSGRVSLLSICMSTFRSSSVCHMTVRTLRNIDIDSLTIIVSAEQRLEDVLCEVDMNRILLSTITEALDCLSILGISARGVVKVRR